MMRFIAAFFLLVMLSGQAVAAAAPKVGVVDLKRAVTECKEGVAARANLLKITEQLNAELKVLQADYEKMRAEFEKNVTKISADARAEKEMEFRKKSREYQNRQSEAQEELKQIESNYLKKIAGRLSAIMTELGDEGKFSVILDRNANVFYVGKEIDITPLLIQRADVAFEKMQAKNENN